jgi:hypothetical protein
MPEAPLPKTRTAFSATKKHTQSPSGPYRMLGIIVQFQMDLKCSIGEPLLSSEEIDHSGQDLIKSYQQSSTCANAPAV